MNEYALSLVPQERVLMAHEKLEEEPAHTTLKITNNSKDRCAFKVKCTSIELFKARPPLGILRNGDSTSIDLVFNPCSIPYDYKHYFAIHYIKVGDDKKTARQFWQDHKGEPTGTKRLYVDFKKLEAAADTANNNDKEKKDEKKEDKKDEEKKDDKEKKAFVQERNDDIPLCPDIEEIYNGPEDEEKKEDDKEKKDED